MALLDACNSYSEVCFYNNALEAVKRGRAFLAEAGVPYKRPEDFLCEMIKTDVHMDKVMHGQLSANDFRHVIAPNRLVLALFLECSAPPEIHDTVWHAAFFGGVRLNYPRKQDFKWVQSSGDIRLCLETTIVALWVTFLFEVSVSAS